ncbi:phage holin family protein [Proteus mirabilis]|uniref:phage holin family protein n=1 Tax=Proteus mirabilis TaxID=584 RepID=UPI003AF01BEA
MLCWVLSHYAYTNDYAHADPFEVGINITLCALIILSRGNVMQIFRGVSKNDTR